MNEIRTLRWIGNQALVEEIEHYYENGELVERKTRKLVTPWWMQPECRGWVGR